MTQISDRLLYHENMDEILNAVSKFSSGDGECSYELIAKFLEDENFLKLPLIDENVSNLRALFILLLFLLLWFSLS